MNYLTKDLRKTPIGILVERTKSVRSVSKDLGFSMQYSCYCTKGGQECMACITQGFFKRHQLLSNGAVRKVVSNE